MKLWCNTAANVDSNGQSSIMKRVQILGIGCPTCEKLRNNAEAAVAELGIEATVELITDVNAIVSFDVLMTPALVIDGDVKRSARFHRPTTSRGSWHRSRKRSAGSGRKMNVKNACTTVLLMFVAASLVVLVAKSLRQTAETRRLTTRATG